MDELVKRLREYAKQWKVSHVPNIADEAADRIVLLEKALQTLTTKLYADLDGGRKIRRYDVDKASAALGKKKE